MLLVYGLQLFCEKQLGGFSDYNDWIFYHVCLFCKNVTKNKDLTLMLCFYPDHSEMLHRDRGDQALTRGGDDALTGAEVRISVRLEKMQNCPGIWSTTKNVIF